MNENNLNADIAENGWGLMSFSTPVGKSGKSSRGWILEGKGTVTVELVSTDTTRLSDIKLVKLVLGSDRCPPRFEKEFGEPGGVSMRINQNPYSASYLEEQMRLEETDDVVREIDRLGALFEEKESKYRKALSNLLHTASRILAREVSMHTATFGGVEHNAILRELHSIREEQTEASHNIRTCAEITRAIGKLREGLSNTTQEGV